MILAGYCPRHGHGLPPHRRVCYKRYMRKWMDERRKRRKKAGEGAPKEQASAPAPLQPKYFESDLGEQPKSPAVEPHREELAPETQADFQLSSRAGSEAAGAEARSGEAHTRPARRRRKRGGRGGARRSPGQREPTQTAFAQAAGTEAVATEAVPVVLTEAEPENVSEGAP